MSLKMMKRKDSKHVCALTFLEAVKTLLVIYSCVCYQIFIFNKEGYSFLKREYNLKIQNLSYKRNNEQKMTNTNIKNC